MKVKEIINIETLFVELEGLEVNPTIDLILEVPPFDECMKMDYYAFASLPYSKILHNLFTKIIKPEQHVSIRLDKDKITFGKIGRAHV